MYEVAIVGAGPAGISAAGYLKRAGFNIIVFERNKIGGLLRNANLVENYPGFPNGIPGPELVRLFTRQLQKWDVVIIEEEVKKISRHCPNFHLETDKADYESRAVIVATGTKPKKMGIDGEEDLAGERLFYEVADLPRLFGDKRAVVVGGGDAAFDYALTLSVQGADVKIIFRGTEPQCLPLLVERVKNDGQIEVCPVRSVKAVEVADDRIKIKCDNETMDTDCVLVAVGREPNDELIKRIEGDGFYAAGDLVRRNFRQVGIAVGDGLIAAMSAEKYLKGK